MSNRLRRKSRPQADVELDGGPLKQRTFDGGVCIDRPASEIGENQLANAENVICFKQHVEARPGTKKATKEEVDQMPGTGRYHQFAPNNTGGQYILHRGDQLFTIDSPTQLSDANEIFGWRYGAVSDVADMIGDSDSTIRPFRRGNLIFNSQGILYYRTTNNIGLFQINAPNPAHGLLDSNGGTVYERRYLVTLGRLDNDTGVVHESGSNAAAYYDSGAVDRNTDYASVVKDTAWGVGTGHAFTNAELKTIISTLGQAADDGAAPHFNYIRIYGTLSLGANSLDPETNKGNSRNTYVWLGDVQRSLVVDNLPGGTFTDEFTDDELRVRLKGGQLLASRGFLPLPSGAAGEATTGFIFVADRETDLGKSAVYYSQVDASPQHMGYYFPGSQFKEFGDAITALKATQDILTIFCANSTHTCTLTAWQEIGTLQSVLTLSHWVTVDETTGVKDWGTISQVDKGTMIAVCSDASVRLWDTTKWGVDISFERVNSEISRIVPANPAVQTNGSFGVFHKGAYYLFYSKDTADTYLYRCLRYGFGDRAGHGWTFYTNWIALPFRCGAVSVLDNALRVQRLIGLSTHDFGGHEGDELYWLETFDTFEGATELGDDLARTNTDGVAAGTAGTDDGEAIECLLRFREMTAQEESEELVHRETHAGFRPLVEADGYLDDFQVGLSAYVNGSIVADDTINDVPKTGDWHFTKEVSGRRIQIELTTSGGAFRLVSVDNHCRSLDRVNYATAGDNVTSESTTSDAHLQKALSTGLIHWLTRRNPTLDRATGRLRTSGGTPTMVTGPDGKASSSYDLNGTPLVFPAGSSALTGDFSVLMAIKGITNTDMGKVINIAGTTPFYVELGRPSTARMTNSLTGSILLFGPGFDTTTWALMVLQRSGSTWTRYFRDELTAAWTANSSTLVSTASVGGGVVTLGSAELASAVYDLRVYNKLFSQAERDYWFTDVIESAGSKTLPMV